VVRCCLFAREPVGGRPYILTLSAKLQTLISGSLKLGSKAVNDAGI
jgi:hypothetical protein